MKAGSQRVLCADDNLCYRHFVSRFLIENGCEVAEAGTAGETLSLAQMKPQHYDLLIIADWLPDMDGVELIQTLRSIPYVGRIVITAPKMLSYRRAAYETLGACAALITPVCHSDLMRILKYLRTDRIGEHRPNQPGDATAGRIPDCSGS